VGVPNLCVIYCQVTIGFFFDLFEGLSFSTDFKENGVVDKKIAL
jgi:hypothetical protein